MNYIHLIAVMMVILFMLAYYSMKNSYANYSAARDKKYRLEYREVMIYITLAALVVRFICGYNYNLHTDIGCFNYWSDHVYSQGFGKFYETASFADYPPGYMYILWVVAFVKDIFNIETYTSLGTLMIKSPAIIFDVATAIIVYKIAKKHLSQYAALLCFVMYIFNPVVIFNSAVWGQVDSVFGLGIFLMCYFIYIKNTKLAYICYGMAALIKPQAFMFTPILMFGMAEEIFVKEGGIFKNNKLNIGFNFKAFKEQGLWCLGSVIVTALIAAPFNLETVIGKYMSTMASYEYASVNAYNLWSMFGLDWISQDNMAFGIKYQTWGTMAIILICIISVIIWCAKSNDRSRYFVIAIFISVAMFTFSVRMHERYIYPGVIMLLFLFIINKQRKSLWFYGVFSIAHFYNAAHVLFYYDPSNFDRRDPVIIIVSLLHVAISVLFIKYCHDAYIGSKTEFSKIDESI